MTVEILIRQLERAHLDPLLALYRQLHEHDDPLPARAELETLWTGILSDPAQIYLGAFIGSELVAACNACVIPNLTRGARPHAMIENVVTHAQHRRKGIGAKLMRSMLDLCCERRCYKVTLTSALTRAEMHGFYEALGFDKHSKQAFVFSMGPK